MQAIQAMDLFPAVPVGFIGVTGISNYTGGPGAGGEVKYGFNSIQMYDDLFWTKGIHSLKFGANVERLQDNELGTSKPNGVFNFTSLANFLDRPACRIQRGTHRRKRGPIQLSSNDSRNVLRGRRSSSLEFHREFGAAIRDGDGANGSERPANEPAQPHRQCAAFGLSVFL